MIMEVAKLAVQLQLKSNNLDISNYNQSTFSLENYNWHR